MAKSNRNAVFQLTTSGFDKITGDFKDLKHKFKQKKIRSIDAAGLYVIQFIRQKIPQKKSGYSKIFGSKAFIKTPDGQIHSKRPTSWIKGKQVVGDQKGRKVVPENNPKHRWNKSSTEGGMPISHPLGHKHQLKELVFFKPNAARNGLLIYADPWRQNAKYKRKGWDGSEMDMSVLEAGGSYQWTRRYVAGYYAETTNGVQVHKGGGDYIDGKKDKNSKALKVGKSIDKRTGKLRVLIRGGKLKNKSGRRQSNHVRTFKKPHVRFQKLYLWKQGTASMKPRPFLRLGIRAFIRNQWPKLWEDLCTVQNADV